MTMTVNIDCEDYLAISKWIQNANNFAGKNVHQDSSVDWFVDRSGGDRRLGRNPVIVLELIPSEVDDITIIAHESYRVDKEVYDKWKDFTYDI